MRQMGRPLSRCTCYYDATGSAQQGKVTSCQGNCSRSGPAAPSACVSSTTVRFSCCCSRQQGTAPRPCPGCPLPLLWSWGSCPSSQWLASHPRWPSTSTVEEAHSGAVALVRARGLQAADSMRACTCPPALGLSFTPPIDARHMHATPQLQPPIPFQPCPLPTARPHWLTGTIPCQLSRCPACAPAYPECRH